MNVGHARVLTAFAAAIILHALLLSWPLSTHQQLSISQGLLQVDLLKNAASTTTKSAPSPTVASRAQPASHARTSPESRQKPVAADTAMAVQKTGPAPVEVKEAQSSIIKPPSEMHRLDQTARFQTVHKADSTPDDHGTAVSATLPSVMTAGVRSMLRASIHYPAQARRHGWQGVGEFQLDIASQNIRGVTMLVSTGHAILDRAVHRGLARIDHVPVADGHYLLPVEFRLQ